MKRLKTEYWFDEGARHPSKSFFRELSRQVSPVVYDLIDDGELREAAPELLCLSFMGPRSYENGQVRMDIASKTAAFILCGMTISWQAGDGSVPEAWEAFGPEDAVFKVSMKERDRRLLNELLPQLYHPVVKAAQSGLPFDYQIYYGGQGLTVSFAEDIQELDGMRAAIHAIHGKMPIHCSGLTQKGKRQVCLSFDVAPRNKEMVEALISEFAGVAGIVKIVCR